MPVRKPHGPSESLPIIRDYKGFRSRQAYDHDMTRIAGWQNAFYICDDGEERCVGQTDDIVKTAEHFLRRPLPTWITKKPEAWSPHSDPERIANTCGHDVPLSQICDKCHESYGNARTR